MEKQEVEKEIQEPITKDLKFKEYSSLELATRDKFIKKIREEGFDKENILWVATEKIHGSNFSVHYNGDSVKYGRRTDFFTKDIPTPCENIGQYFLETFYDAKTMVTKFHNKLPEVYQNIKSMIPKMLKISIYGEYFGGNWPSDHPLAKKGGPKHVQKGVYYTPDHQFFAFDIFITTEDSAYWADVIDIPKLLKDLIPSVPLYAKGTFDEIFDIETKFDSTIPQILGLPKIEKNLVQGLVLRPNHNCRISSGDRVILKKKNKEFLEMVAQPNPAKKEKKQKVIAPELVHFIDDLSKYLNMNRIDSVVSKYPDVKDRNKLKIEVVKDILTDAGKDEWKKPETEEIMKRVSEEFDKMVLKEINNYFVKH